ncbi:Glucose--fructose oxidoreductase precursor [Paraliobacillus sp. PM-2]|uniref:Gfo/Idh/MocA family protein n=1 Tax=Paraliobacillus sp. PM-2 TaxID=1462524 RepID=UPI00061BAA0B|nr:Gfo/Idh/MocA family oxidoreductase [Paraliobacillus sp. PM-2]CQR47338.1 Glucose--fructose oxidoreductase precursor [Paraliobacillus sp. PM-2]
MVRFGVIGTNWITESFIQAAMEIEDFQLTAVYSRTMEKAEQFASKFNESTTIFTDLQSFFENDMMDAVYIASPNALHAEQAILAMEHGKHVIVEKPMASNTREVKEMFDTAKANNVVLMEALKTTFLPNFQSIQDNLHKIGTVRRYFSSFCQYSSRYDAYKDGTLLNAFKPELSNGSLMDIGIYCIYPMVALFGEPKRLYANAYMLESGVDGQGSVMFDYDEMNGAVMYSKITNSYLQSEIQGEHGSILINKISRPTKVEIHYKDGTVEDITRPQKENSMYYEAKGFIDAIHAGQNESSVNTFEKSYTTAAILEEARKQFGLTFPADTK